MAQDAGDAMAIIEAPREIIEYFNRGRMIQAFDAVGYFIYHGVCVCETGKKADIEAKIAESETMLPAEYNKKYSVK
jgi:hypothetical protein